MLKRCGNLDVFKYNSDDFHNCVDENENESTFDSAVKEKWEKAETDGTFRYILNITKWKILEGQYKLLAQLNLDRASNRRIPEHITSMAQPFDSSCFNFTKLAMKEILFDVGSGDGDNILAFNISPIEWGHCLLLTERLQCLPQTTTKFSLSKALAMLLLSSSPYLRIIFNSLCAHASVNHLHWHLYYLKHKMLLEYIDVQEYIGPVFLLVDFPSKGFCLKRSCTSDMENFISWAFSIICYLQQHYIAHNIFITRAKSVWTSTKYDDIRIYIWARESYIGAKNTSAFVPAVSELSGHLVIKTEEAYETLTEQAVSEILTGVTETDFLKVKEELKPWINEHLRI